MDKQLHKVLSLLFILFVSATILVQCCNVSEFACRVPTKCLPMDKYCDGKDDCGDGSDEPKSCTVCNRTYYGDVGRTYSLKVPPPQWNRLPFFCHITFTASGQDQGDIVQIIFDEFSVGRFDEGLLDSESDRNESHYSNHIGDLPGCPEGFMQLSELGRPFTGGSWCGQATGQQIYFSETSTVTASVKVFHAPMQAATPFEFRIRYRFISQSEAIVRHGVGNELLELGRVTPGTYCTRQFDECYRKNCRLQSPNYPGMYPRNVTCYWTIRQKSVPTCKHAMIAISQENSHKSLVKRSIASLNKTFKSIRAWSDCTGERDHLIFYDGSSTNDPVLAKYCGGDWLPKVVSRASEMLIAFHSSPFSAPLQSNVPNRGFELNVDILYTDSDSYDYAQGVKNSCEFHINASNPDDIIFSRRGRMGKILSPRHTLPPNTTCTYHFHGQPNDLVWISFTSYHLQMLQHIIPDNSTVHRSELPPWIVRLRMWDSIGTHKPASSFGVTPNSWHAAEQNVTEHKYYYSSNNPIYGKKVKVNIDNVWYPVDSYIYDQTQNSVFNQEHKYSSAPVQATPPMYPTRPAKGNNLFDNVKDPLSFLANLKYNKGFDREHSTIPTAAPSRQRDREREREREREQDRMKATRGSQNRKLIVELYDNETPRLCDHNLLEDTQNQVRPCSPMESYLSSSNDMKIEFQSYTGTSLYPTAFSLKYEFVDTDLGGEKWLGRKGEETVPVLCSRVFRKKRGNFQSPRNVFLHGRGGAKNLTCLYRFEAGAGEKVRISIHNVSFGENSPMCTTEMDIHSMRPKCVQTTLETDPSASETLIINGRQASLQLFDVPYRDVKIPLACFCDNTSSLYSNSPLTVQSNTRTMELIFSVNKLNISEDFADIYFHASYEFITEPECPRRLRLRGGGGSEHMQYALSAKDQSCVGHSWYLETQEIYRSLFIMTWGYVLPVEPTMDDILRCNSKNRLLVYSGRPLKVVKIICPTQPSTPSAALYIYSEDWLNLRPQTRPVNLVLEPILRESGHIAFHWLEISRTKASIIQYIEAQSNLTLNDTLEEFGILPREADCEFKCPELDACIDGNLWCDGQTNCPSGIDESEKECGTAHKLLELPGGIFAAMGGVAAIFAVCFLICILCMVRGKKNKSVATSKSINGLNTASQIDFRKDPLFIDDGS